MPSRGSGPALPWRGCPSSTSGSAPRSTPLPPWSRRRSGPQRMRRAIPRRQAAMACVRPARAGWRAHWEPTSIPARSCRRSDPRSWWPPCRDCSSWPPAPASSFPDRVSHVRRGRRPCRLRADRHRRAGVGRGSRAGVAQLSRQSHGRGPVGGAHGRDRRVGPGDGRGGRERRVLRRARLGVRAGLDPAPFRLRGLSRGCPGGALALEEVEPGRLPVRVRRRRSGTGGRAARRPQAPRHDGRQSRSRRQRPPRSTTTPTWPFSARSTGGVGRR